MLLHGEIVERGTHEELIKKQGVYYEMWDRQKQEDETEHVLGEDNEVDDGVYVQNVAEPAEVAEAA